jgi:hypothetical protein
MKKKKYLTQVVRLLRKWKRRSVEEGREPRRDEGMERAEGGAVVGLKRRKGKRGASRDYFNGYQMEWSTPGQSDKKKQQPAPFFGLLLLSGPTHQQDTPLRAYGLGVIGRDESSPSLSVWNKKVSGIFFFSSPFFLRSHTNFALLTCLRQGSHPPSPSIMFFCVCVSVFLHLNCWRCSALSVKTQKKKKKTQNRTEQKDEPSGRVHISCIHHLCPFCGCVPYCLKWYSPQKGFARLLLHYE